MRVRLLFLLALIGVLCLPDAAVAQDASPTAVVVTPPSSEGCDDIDEFMGELSDIEELARARWEDLFPGSIYLADMTRDEWINFLLSRSPDQLGNIVDFSEWRIGLVRDLEEPVVAAAFINTRLDRQQVVANLLRDAQTIGVLASALLYSDTGEQLEGLMDAHGQAALSVCPDFQQVLDYYAEDDEGTPEAG